MANSDAPRGLEPIPPIHPPTRYPITASYATALYIGDPVVGVAGGTIERHTVGANPIRGVIAGFEKAGEGPQLYFPASSSGTWYALVYDNPHQRFIAQEDGDTSDLALTDRHNGANLIVTHAGSTTTGLSGFEIDSSSKGTSASKAIRLIDIVQDGQNAIGDYCRWVITIHNHQASPGIVGVSV